MTSTTPKQTDDAWALLELETAAHADVVLPADAHVIGEPVTITQIRYPELPRVGLLATCRRGELTYELSLADVVFPTASAGAFFVARYRTWLGLVPLAAPGPEGARAHKVEGDDIVVGRSIDLVVLACKSNALRCRLLKSTREVTLRTAVRNEIPGSIITVTPRKQWTHARHPYLSGDVSSVRIDACALGLVPLLLHREDDPHLEPAGRHTAGGGRAVYRMETVSPGASDREAPDLLIQAQECIDAHAYAEADDLLHKALAVDLRCLDAHALLAERNFPHWPALALHHFELGVSIGSLTVGDDFDGVLPWGLLENRPFLRCLQGLSRALLRLDRRDAAAAVLRWLLLLDPDDHLSARASLAAIEVGRTWREMETAP
jgi:hypothetical protein